MHPNNIILQKYLSAIYNNVEYQKYDALPWFLNPENFENPSFYQLNNYYLARKVRGYNDSDTFNYDNYDVELAKENASDELQYIAEFVASKLPAEYYAATLHTITKSDFKTGVEVACKLLKLIQNTVVAPDALYDDLLEYAKAQTERYSKYYALYKHTVKKCKETAFNIFLRHIDSAEKHARITFAADITPEGFYKRCKDTAFWTRNADKQAKKVNVQIARVLGLLGRGYAEHDKKTLRALHLPHNIVQREHRKIKHTNDWLASTVLTDGATNKTLADITKNAAQNKLNELQIRVQAQHNLAVKNGLTAHLLTLTLPSRFHSMTTVQNGKKSWAVNNPKFDINLTASDGVEWFAKKWQGFRARLRKLYKKHGLKNSDFDFLNVLEGHNDATPHRHAILYFPAKLFDEIKALLDDIYLYEQNYSDKLDDEKLDKGAKKRRVNLQKIRKENGAVRYAMKALRYPLKNLGGDPDKPTGEAMYARVVGARAFSTSKQNVTFWRFLRETPDPCELSAELWPAWFAARGLNMEKDKQTHKRNIFGQAKPAPEHYKYDSCDASNFQFFLESEAFNYKPYFTTDDFYEIEYKTAADYENVDGKLTATGYLQMRADWREGNAIKSKTPKLNKYGERIKPKPTKYYRICKKTGRVHSAKNPYIKKWQLNEQETKRLRDERRAKQATITQNKYITQLKKEAKLQLLIYSRGAAKPHWALLTANEREQLQAILDDKVSKQQARRILAKIKAKAPPN